ncbi:unnamed protein product, partial [Phaeothamnion confervicola]
PVAPSQPPPLSPPPRLPSPPPTAADRERALAACLRAARRTECRSVWLRREEVVTLLDALGLVVTAAVGAGWAVSAGDDRVDRVEATEAAGKDSDADVSKTVKHGGRNVNDPIAVAAEEEAATAVGATADRSVRLPLLASGGGGGSSTGATSKDHAADTATAAALVAACAEFGIQLSEQSSRLRRRHGRL